jgi:hypothetical protein
MARRLNQENLVHLSGKAAPAWVLREMRNKGKGDVQFRRLQLPALPL